MTMWAAIGSVFLAARDWCVKFAAAMSFQRADFEAVNTSWKDLAAALKKRLDEMDAEYKQHRRHDQYRIRELEREAEECRAFREKDIAETEALRAEVRVLRAEVARLKGLSP